MLTTAMVGASCAVRLGALPLAPVAPTAERPGVVAHRGVALEAPENTLPAIAKAIELGCALAEIDLRYTRDGAVVLLHDATLDRTTDATGSLALRTLAELRAVDAGARKGDAFRGTRIPTLEEAIALARARIQLYLDLKEPDPLPVVRLVERLEARSMVFYRPYSYTALRQILAEAPASRVLVDLGDWLQAPGQLDLLRRTLPTAAVSSDWRNWEPRAVSEARGVGLTTFVNVLGPADTPENLRAAVGLGFDFIQTDHPRRLLEILRPGHAARQNPPARGETVSWPPSSATRAGLLTVRGLEGDRRAAVFDALLALPKALGEPHAHAGLGIRKLHASGIWEARVGLDLRLVFALQPDLLTVARGPSPSPRPRGGPSPRASRRPASGPRRAGALRRGRSGGGTCGSRP